MCNIYHSIGIYGITNRITGTTYIGQTRNNFGDRRDSHFSLLRHGKHSNKPLQNDWNAYGEDAFVFWVIEECEIDCLSEREKFWIDQYRMSGLSYNIAYGDVPFFLGRHLSDEAKESIARKNKEHMTGRRLTEETKAKMSRSHTGIKTRPMSDDGKANLSMSHIDYAINHPKKLTVEDVRMIRQLHDDGLTYTLLSQMYHVSYTCINDICRYKRWKTI